MYNLLEEMLSIAAQKHAVLGHKFGLHILVEDATEVEWLVVQVS